MRLLISVCFLMVVATSAVAAQTIYSSAGKVITYYVPHNAPNCKRSVEGCIETSRPGLTGVNKPTCLDAVRVGQAKYVTLASDASNYGRYYHIGTITYRSALDSQIYTVKDVVGYVHDTGGAFRGRPDKLDVCTTVCATCSDAQASAFAQGKNVALIRSGLGEYDPMTPTYGSPFSTNPYSPVHVNPYSSQGAYSGYGGGVSSQLGGQSGSVSPFGVGVSSGGGGSAAVTTGADSRAALTILVQPQKAVRGGPVLVSWTSVNMKPQSCVMTRDGAEFARGNEATQRYGIPDDAQSIEFSLECETGAGEKATAKTILTF